MKLFNLNITSKQVTTTLLIWVLVCSIIPNIWLSLTERMSIIQSITNVILPLGVYMLLMSISRKVGPATLWMIIIFIFAAFQMVLLYMYGRSIIAVDMFLNVVTTNPDEVGELLGNLTVIIAAVVLIFPPPIIMGTASLMRSWHIRSSILKRTRRLSILTIAIGLICFGLSFTSARPYNPVCDLFPVNVIYNLCTAVNRTIKVARYDNTSSDFTYQATSQRPDTMPELYVLVIGETARAANWQINGYNRPTTPRLMNLQGLTSFSKAISQSNTTHKSVPMLLSPLEASNFGDSIYQVKSLITAFKEAGFSTAFFSCHRRNRSFIDFFGDEADTTVFIKEELSDSVTTLLYDTDLLPYFDRAIAAGNRKQLIVLHSYGSHFNYIDRYPESEAVFQPDRPASASYQYRREQINAYDNTILFTSNMIADIVERLKATGKVGGLIYASDHGEDIFDDERRLFLHASPIPSYYQIHVPMLVWLSDRYRQQFPDKQSALSQNCDKYVSPSRSVFHSLMDMAGISTQWNQLEHSVLNSDYKSGSSIYLNDHNKAVELNKCGILDYDTKMFNKLGI